MTDTRGPAEGRILITEADVMDSHVDDILNRQKNLLGEKKVTYAPMNRWYMQNWFVYGLAGALAAFLMWAVIEPHFNDTLEFHGRMEEVNFKDALPKRVQMGFHEEQIDQNAFGWIRIEGQKIWISEYVRGLKDGKVVTLYPDDLVPGNFYKVYLDYMNMTGSDGIAIANFIEVDAENDPDLPLPLVTQEKRHFIISLLLFPLMAGGIGLLLGAAEGLVCRRYMRALAGGIIGMLVGFLGGFVVHIPAGAIYATLSNYATTTAADSGGFHAMAMMIQVLGRSLAWGVAGMAMGIGQGIALKSGRLLSYGLMGGLIGGLAGGMLFDPIDLLILRGTTPSAHMSRMIGFMAVGLSVGMMIGIVQLLARDGWFKMIQGPLAGKEFILFKDSMTIGASPKSDIYLFNDPQVMDRHATVRTVGDNFELEVSDKNAAVYINDRLSKRSKLNNGDRVTLGKTTFVFHMKKN